MLKKLLGIGVVVFFGLLGIIGYWQWAVRPVDSKNSPAQIFVIPQGQSAQIIAKRLKDEKLIKSIVVFKLLVDRRDLSNKLQAGDFRLSSSMDLNMIIDSLTHGSLDYWITLPEGLRVEEYAERLAAESDINPQAFIVAAKPYEGQLFPDTYLIPQSASNEDIISLCLRTGSSPIFAIAPSTFGANIAMPSIPAAATLCSMIFCRFFLRLRFRLWSSSLPIHQV